MKPFIDDICLTTIDKLQNKKINSKNVFKKKKAFDYIDTSKVFPDYEYLHAINFNKIVNTQNEYRFNSLIEPYEDEGSKFMAKYFCKLETFNEELFKKIKNNYPKTNTFDCIIMPESSNEHMRIGLFSRPKNYYNAPLWIAKKTSNFQASIDDDASNVDFMIPKEAKKMNNILVLDDCKAQGLTIKSIISKFNSPKLIVHAYYLLDEKKNNEI